MQKFLVSRDDAWYHGWPDVALCDSGRLVCVFSECTHHWPRTETRIVCVTSDDRGRTWTAKCGITERLHKVNVDYPHWNCPRVTALADGRLVCVVDRIAGAREGNGANAEQSNWLFYSEDGGESWGEGVLTPVRGIVPDKLVVLKSGPWAGRWILSAHTGVEGVWTHRAWLSDDQGQSWRGPIVVGAEPELLLCEGNIVELPGGELVCFLRENSFKGLDGFKSISRDGGETWGPVHALASPGLHRPVGGVLQNGKVLITHRYVPGGRSGWGFMTQNTFASLFDVESCLEEDRSKQGSRVMPLDYDRSPHSDGGYTGWVQFEDGEIYIVNYLVDDAPKGQIRGYSLAGDEFVLPG